MRAATRLLLISFSIAALAWAAAAGDLNPPPGPVDQTMKTLDQVEAWTVIDPRTAVGDEGAVVLITQSGRYRLVGDIVGQPGKHGIRVTADDVSIDTNGFSLIGVPGSLDGVRCEGSRSTIGPVRWMAPESIRAWGGNGVTCTNAARVTVRNLEITGCGGSGMVVFGTGVAKTDVTNVEVNACGGGGVVLDGMTHVELHELDVDACGTDGVRAIVNGAVLKTYFETGRVSVTNCGGDGVETSGYTICQCTHLIVGDTGGNGVLIVGSETVRLSDVDIVGAGLWGIDIDSTSAPAADVKVEKFNVRQEFGPNAGGARCRTSGGGGGGGRIALIAGAVYDTGDTGVLCTGYQGAEIRGLTIGSSGADGVVLRPDAGSTGTRTRIDDLDAFGSVGDDVNFNPLATGGAHDLAVNGGDLSGAGGNAISVVPQAAGTYEFDLRVSDTRMLRSAGNGFLFQPAQGVTTTGTFISMENCRTSGNGGDGSKFQVREQFGPTRVHKTACVSTGNTGDGLDAEWVALEITGGSYSGNTGNGVRCLDSSCRNRDSNTSENGINGVLFATTFTKKGYDAYQAKSDANAVSGMNIDGAEATIVHCFASSNLDNGIDLSNCDASLVQHCVANKNANRGIWSRATTTSSGMVDNRCSLNAAGIQVDGSGMFVARNSATVGPIGGIIVAQGNNLVGPAVDAGNIATEGSPNANMNR